MGRHQGNIDERRPLGLSRQQSHMGMAQAHQHKLLAADGLRRHA
ncbi:hypothetical protein V5738_11745 [Salinisphaera sp. SPP-AMP-43]